MLLEKFKEFSPAIQPCDIDDLVEDLVANVQLNDLEDGITVHNLPADFFAEPLPPATFPTAQTIHNQIFQNALIPLDYGPQVLQEMLNLQDTLNDSLLPSTSFDDIYPHVGELPDTITASNGVVFSLPEPCENPEPMFYHPNAFQFLSVSSHLHGSSSLENVIVYGAPGTFDNNTHYPGDSEITVDNMKNVDNKRVLNNSVKKDESDDSSSNADEVESAYDNVNGANKDESNYENGAETSENVTVQHNSETD